MKLFPAIDIYNGQSVRLKHGDFNQVTVYGNPQDMAQNWVKQGAEYLHLVDLNGAKQGCRQNAEIIRDITNTVLVPTQLGGGIRTMTDIDFCLSELNVTRVILGTVCYQQPDLIAKAIEKYGEERIVCGIDARDGKVSIKGWLEQADVSPIALGLKMKAIGLKYVVYTDISRDGALTGVNIDACEKMMQETGLNVIASGGLNSLNDICSLQKKNLYGAILGKAIYEKIFTVTQAVALLCGE